MLDPRRLLVLAEVARQGSIGAAAEALNFVPSAVSQQISSLEQETGVELTSRVGRGIVLTDAGRLLAEHGAEISVRLNRAEADLSDLREVGGRLRVASFQSVGATLVARALVQMSSAMPEVELSLVEVEPAESIPALKRYELDVALTYHYQFVEPVSDPELEDVFLLTDQMRLLVPGRHPARNLVGIGLERFRNDVWIVDHPGTPAHTLTIRACQEAGFEPRIAYTTDDYLVATRLVQGGLGVAMVPALAATTIDGGVVLADLRSPPGRDVLATVRIGTRSQSVRTFVGLLLDQAAAIEEGSGH